MPTHHKRHHDKHRKKHEHRRRHAHGELVQLNAGVHRRRHPAAFVDHTWFNILVGIVVLANAVTIGLEIDYGKQNESLYSTINSVFLLVYIVELCLRVLVHGLWIFTDPMILFDLALVVTAVIERALEGGLDNPAMPTFRLMRIFRLAKTWKVLKHRRDLSTMFRMLRRVAVTLTWVVFLLFFFLWSCATFAYRGIGQSDAWNDALDPEREDPRPFDTFNNFEYFGSVERSFFSLFQLMTLSQWAGAIARPIFNVYPASAIFLVTFFFLTSYGLLICILAVIVQDSLASNRDGERRIDSEINTEERDDIGRRALQMLAMADANGSGKLDVHELDSALQSPQSGLRELLQELGVPILDAASLIAMMDTNGDKRVNYTEIVEGALRMGDPIDHSDYILVSLRLENLTVRTRKLEARLQKLTSSIGVIRSTCAEGFAAVEHTVNTADATKLRQRALQNIRSAKPPDAPPSTARTKSKALTRLANAAPLLAKAREWSEMEMPLMQQASAAAPADEEEETAPPVPSTPIPPATISWPRFDVSAIGMPPALKQTSPQPPHVVSLPAPRRVQAWSTAVQPDRAPPTPVAVPKKMAATTLPQRVAPATPLEAAAGAAEGPRADLLPGPPPGIRVLVQQAVAVKMNKKDVDDPYKLQDLQPAPAFARLKAMLR
mmetsp:Transcript_43970/g.104066  ORF Transcript_43970/g.104066 Transcript_43970/m.104066 type:complete len:664 (+) Transcript_43970:118-2109(+)